MALSEKLYELRKKRALSQEQLAEQLGVSRQAISKWESGKAVPETDTLISISKYFDVSLDYLMKEENSISENAVSLEVHQTEATNKREKRILGIATCIIGVVLLIAWGIVSVFMPSASEQIGTSSMITIDGNGIFLLICLVAIIAGAVIAYNYCDMMWGIKYAGYSAPVSTAFLVAIPFAIAIVVCVVIALYFKKRIG